MEGQLRSTLLAEGTSDRALLPIIRLALAAHVRSDILLADPIQADQARLAPRVSDSRATLIRSVIEEYPCELLFLHRDADNAGRDKRLDEIDFWTKEAGVPASGVVPVIPVRMTETWLLVDERAIRRAASNPNGSAALDLPLLNSLERLSNPKDSIDSALRTASGLRSGKLRKFDVRKAKGRIAVTDLANLRRLPAFVAFEQDVALACVKGGWSDSLSD